MAKQKAKGLVVVESPAKAKKISDYLGRNYKVMASMGHVRDLPTSAAEIPPDIKKESWASLGVNVEADFEPFYVVPSGKKKIIRELKSALKNADELILATDEDREGESIGWHLAALLKPKVPIKRMVFSEITEEAIKKAVETPRELNLDLVSAQEARRVLDRLYGYTLSPLLWKKVGRGLSAGRVQSVAVRLTVLREKERRAFHSGTYWDLKATLATAAEEAFVVQLARLGERRIATGKDFDESTGQLKAGADVLLLNGEQAEALRQRLQTQTWTVSSIEVRQQARKPNAPFITSTLQQEASRKLGMSARQTMQVAQRLYEDGHITYMRTDSVHLSNEAIEAARRCVQERYGQEYLHPQPRQYTSQAKRAQEAHEAIRPAGAEMRPGTDLELNGAELKLYDLVWKRTIASQMADAQLRFQTANILAGDAEFRATGRHVEFPGFFKVYVEGVDDQEADRDDQETDLPPLTEGQALKCTALEALSHETKPPARYTEATLIRTLESEGIGRPSTYANIIGTIQERGYVRKVGPQLVPTFTALVVTDLLEEYFPKLIDIGFTADMEQMLDDVSTGEADYRPYLRTFYSGDSGLQDQVKEKEESIDPRQARTLKWDTATANIHLGRHGPYLQKDCDGEVITVSIPETLAPADLTDEVAEKLIARKQQSSEPLGSDPATGLPVFVLEGPFGPYVQLGEAQEGNGKAQKSVSIPPNIDPENIGFDTALALLSLPRVLGTHPETGNEVKAGIGRFGPYVVHNNSYKSLGKDLDVLTVDLETALKRLQQKTRRSSTLMRELGPHPDDGEPIALYEGRYGPYVKHGRLNAAIPKDMDTDKVTLAESVTWLAQAAAKKAEGKKKSSR